MKKISHIVENWSLKKKNVVGLSVFFTASLVPCLFLLPFIHGTGYFVIPVVYFTYMFVFFLNDYMTYKISGDKLPPDFLFELGKAQIYIVPLILTTIILVIFFITRG